MGSPYPAMIRPCPAHCRSAQNDELTQAVPNEKSKAGRCFKANAESGQPGEPGVTHRYLNRFQTSQHIARLDRVGQFLE